MVIILLFSSYVGFEQVYFISVLFVSWWIVSYIIYDRNVLQIITHTHNFMFSFFLPIHFLFVSHHDCSKP